MTVVPDVGVARGTPGMYRVVGENGSTYTVDTDEGACTCPDFEYNLSGDDQCKHLHRVAFATGARSIPSADVSVDPLLGVALDDSSSCSATTVAADGGVVTDNAEVIDDDDTDVWEGPHTEYSQYGEPTGHEYVRCNSCGIEVVDDHREHATHRDDCPHRDD